MKLIDLLVQELPKIGGWPEGYSYIAQDSLGCLQHPGGLFAYEKPPLRRLSHWSADNISGYGKKIMRSDTVSEDCQDEYVTRDQYEAALAASKTPVWNGEGLPPVGCECEGFDGVSWFPVVIVGRYDGFVFAWNYDYRKTLTVNELHSNNFRPIRSEAEHKRDETLCAMRNCVSNFNNTSVIHAIEQCYDAIAAGKIPGVKLEVTP